MAPRKTPTPEVAASPEQQARDVLVDRMARAMSRVDGNRGTACRYQRMARFALLEVEKASSHERVEGVSLG